MRSKKLILFSVIFALIISMGFASQSVNAGTYELTPYAKVDCTRKYYKSGSYIGSGGCSDYKGFSLLVSFGYYSSATDFTFEMNGVEVMGVAADFYWGTPFFLDESDTYSERSSADAIFISPAKNNNPDSMSDYHWTTTICYNRYYCVDKPWGKSVIPLDFESNVGSFTYSLTTGRYYSSSYFYDYSTYHYTFEVGIYNKYIGGGCGTATCL